MSAVAFRHRPLRRFAACLFMFAAVLTIGGCGDSPDDPTGDTDTQPKPKGSASDDKTKTVIPTVELPPPIPPTLEKPADLTNVVANLDARIAATTDNKVLDVLKRWRTHAAGKNTSMKSATYNDGVMPAEVGLLQHLETLSITDESLSALPPEIGWLSQLKGFVCITAKVKTLPAEIKDWTSLEELRIVSRDFVALPPEIGQLPNLERLVVNGGRNMHTLPSEMGDIKTLEYLRWSTASRTTRLPPSIVRLSNLESLILAEVHLKELPDDMGQLTNLTRLDLSDNELTKLPASMSNLVNLKELNLHSNPLTDDCVAILVKLKNLRGLDVSRTELSKQAVERLKKALPKCVVGHSYNY